MKKETYFAVIGMDTTGQIGVFGFPTKSSEAFEQASYINTNGGCARIFLTDSQEIPAEKMEEVRVMCEKFVEMKTQDLLSEEMEENTQN